MSKARDIADLDFNSPDIDGGTIDGATIGATTPAAGTFTNGTVSGSLALSSDSSQLQLGTGNRAQIFHNSNALYLRTSTGGILVQGPSLSHYSSDASTLYFSAASGGLSFGGTNFLTSARNLQNIGTISSGDVTTSGTFNIGSLGSIGAVATDRIFIATADGLGLQLDKDNNRIVPVGADGTTYNNNVSLGSSSLEFKNLALTGTISSGAITSNGGLTIVSDTTYNGILIDTLSSPEIVFRDRGNSDTKIGTGRHGLDDFHIDTYSGNAMLIEGNTRRMGLGITAPANNIHILGNSTTPAAGITIQTHDTANAKAGITLMSRNASNVNENVVHENSTGNAITLVGAGKESIFSVNGVTESKITPHGVRQIHTPYFSGGDANSYSTSTSLGQSSHATYYSAANQYKLIGQIAARAYQGKMCVKTNMTTDNIMYWVKAWGYLYGYGIAEAYAGGYTYQSTNVISKTEIKPAHTNSVVFEDSYRLPDGTLCFRLNYGHTGYTEGRLNLYFHTHGNAYEGVEIVATQTQNDGTNFQFGQ